LRVLVAAGAFSLAFAATSIVVAHEHHSHDEYWFGNQQCDAQNNTVATAPCASDGLHHTFCWGDNFDDGPVRDAASYAMRNLTEQTAFTREHVNCGPVTDVVFLKLAFDGALGAYQCVDTSNTDGPGCQKARVKINADLINALPESELNKEVTSCHEVGHSGGLRHYTNGGDDCLRSGHVSSGHRHYNDHHQVHLNDNNW